MTPMVAAISVMSAAALPKLTVRGPDLVNPTGKVVQLKGVNLGNWFVMEPWMLNWSDIPGTVSDQYQMEEVLQARFGKSEKDRLMDLYRSNWITKRDFPIIKSFGFNVVRLPLNYRLFEDDANPYKLRKDAFKWADHAVKLAADQGLYTILDMHGVQGGQSPYDHTGRSGQNKLWDNPENQKRLAWLWSELAKHYKDNPAVVAYDVFNEPYGGSHTQIKAVFTQSYNSIRKVDREKLIYAMGSYDGYTFYGTPKENNWHNVGYQMHYYPGLFGGGDPTPATHARHLSALATIDTEQNGFNAPFLIGEMNVVFTGAGGGPLMRRYYDQHAANGWATTMWSYKVHNPAGTIGPDSWGMVGNGIPLKPLDIRTATKAEIENLFKSFSTMPYAINEPLRAALTAKVALPVVLPELPQAIVQAPQQSLEGWEVADIAGPLQGGLERNGPNAFTLYGGGSDVWGNQDQFRLLYKKVSGDFSLTVQLVGHEEVNAYAKAGLMARNSLTGDSPHYLASVFPSGEIQVAWRLAKAGGTDSHNTGVKGAFPSIYLQLMRIGQSLSALSSTDGNTWTILHSQDLPDLPSQLYVGAIALSHDNSRLSKISYQNLIVKKN